MKFADFVVPDAIIPELDAEDKEGVIAEMVQALIDTGAVEADEKDDIVRAVMNREELGTTAIGRGVAVPHTKHPSVNRLVGTVAVSTEGVDFKSLDGGKVYAFFLLVSPPDRPGDHLRALENVARQFHNETFCRFLKQARSADDIRQLLQEADEGKYAA